MEEQKIVPNWKRRGEVIAFWRKRPSIKILKTK